MVYGEQLFRLFAASNFFILSNNMEKNIIEIIFNAMVVAQDNKLGNDKKSFVLTILKTEIKNYERYEPMIDMVIDFIKLLSKNKDLLKNFNKKCFLCI